MSVPAGAAAPRPSSPPTPHPPPPSSLSLLGGPGVRDACCSWTKPTPVVPKPPVKAGGAGAGSAAAAVDPTTLWEALLSNHGEVYFWKKSTDEVSWEAPPGWNDANGRVLEGERGALHCLPR